MQKMTGEVSGKSSESGVGSVLFFGFLYRVGVFENAGPCSNAEVVVILSGFVMLRCLLPCEKDKRMRS